jgi:hypothetical protein
VCSFDCDVGVIDPCFACVGGAKIEKMIEFAEMLGVCVCWECAVCVDLSCDTDVSPYMSDTSLDVSFVRRRRAQRPLDAIGPLLRVRAERGGRVVSACCVSVHV